MKIYASEHEMLNELMGGIDSGSRVVVEPEPKPPAAATTPIKRVVSKRQVRQNKVAASPVPGVTGAYLNALNRKRNVKDVTASPVPDVTKAYLHALAQKRRHS